MSRGRARPGRVRIAALTFALVASLGAAPAGAQPAGHPDVEGEAAALADVPAGPATLRGRVVHVERPEAAAGVEVALYALSADGTPSARRTTSGEDGSFAFEGIANDPGVVYLIGARFDGLPFPGERVAFAEGETERAVEIEISDPTDDATGIEVLQSWVRLSWSCTGLEVSEVHRVRNGGERVFHVAPEDRGRRAPALDVALLPGARGFTMPLGLVPEGAVRTGERFRFWGPLYPGEQEISFRYVLPVEPGTPRLEKRFPSAAGRVRVSATDPALLVSASGLARTPGPEGQVGPFQPLERADTPAGFSTEITLQIPDVAAVDPGAVSLLESQFVLEVDDARLQAQEQHRIEVDGAAACAKEGELLVRFPLPAEAEDVRFSADASSLGLVRTEDGVGLVGPIRAGSHVVGLAYGLRSGPDGVHFTRRFDRHLPLLRVFVADTGVVVETDRLHRRRPVRDADRTYLVYEAFEVEPEETLAFGLRALPPRVGSRRPALFVAVIGGLVALGFLLAPLREGGAAPLAAGDDEPPETAREREHLYESIRDLDHDHETGKLDDASWQSLRSELRARAVALLAAERRGAPPAAEPETAAASTPAPACAGCGATARAGDRFCAQCGRPLAEGSPAP